MPSFWGFSASARSVEIARGGVPVSAPDDDGARRAAPAEPSTLVTSPDGLVRARIDASGSLAELIFAPNAFERSTPELLAKSVLTLVQHGAKQVKRQIADLAPHEQIVDSIIRAERPPAPSPSRPAPKPAGARRSRTRPSRDDVAPPNRSAWGEG